jgi:hypothetical protein
VIDWARENLANSDRRVQVFIESLIHRAIKIQRTPAVVRQKA